MSQANLPIPVDFPILLKEIKSRTQSAQTRAIMAVNGERVQLYWDIGRIIAGRQQQEVWGAAVIPRLSRELLNELRKVKGFSERHIKLMLAFYRQYPDCPNLCSKLLHHCKRCQFCHNLLQKYARPEKCRSLLHKCTTQFSGPSLDTIMSS